MQGPVPRALEGGTPCVHLCVHLCSKEGFPGGSEVKVSACSAGDLGSTPGLGRSPGEGKGFPLQSSGLENSTGCIVHGATKSRIQLSDFHQNHSFIPLADKYSVGPGTM